MELVAPPKCRQLYQSTRRHMPIYLNLNSFAVTISLISRVYFIVLYVFEATFQLRVQIQEVLLVNHASSSVPYVGDQSV